MDAAQIMTRDECELLVAARNQYDLAATIAAHAWKDTPNQTKIAKRLLPKIRKLKEKLRGCLRAAEAKEKVT